MGLDIDSTESLLTCRWSYSGFNRFRCRLAKAEGFDLEQMHGFTGDKGRPWSEESSAIVSLLDHSDSDGEMTAEKCAEVWPRLLEIVTDWPEDDYDREQGEKLARMMKETAEKKGTVMFG